MLIRDAEIEGRRLDCRIEGGGGGKVVAIGARLRPHGGERCLDARGGALLPGLHDHHVHLASLAARRASVSCGPPEVGDEATLVRRLAAAPAAPGGWVRGVGYHESVAGWPDRRVLDAWLPGRPLRIQHRGGAWWILSSAALEALELSERAPTGAPAGLETDAAGRPTGRFHRCDAWLRERGVPGPVVDLAEAGRELARRGVASFTDATPDNGPAQLQALRALRHARRLGPEVRLMGSEELAGEVQSARGVVVGELKLILDEPALPALPALRERIRRARRPEGASGGDGSPGRAVAIHCVTRAELALAVAALEEAGPRRGDRLEHASVVPDDWLPVLRRLGVAVVTQPGFVWERGDAYRRDVPEAEQPWLYRGAAFLRAGIPLAAGTDAPFGGPDPWRAMAAAVARHTREGALLGRDEGLAPERALALFTTAPEAPGGPPRRVRVGAPASLCLLDRPWADARTDLAAVAVRATWTRGQGIWCAGI